MREKGSVGVAVCVLTALLVTLLTGCQGIASDRPAAAEEETPGGSGGAAPTQPSGHGAVFLAVDECSSFGTTSFTEVPCTGERAAARVVARYEGRVGDGPLCPGTTDFVLHISDKAPALADEDGDGTIPQGYACMRNLSPPHPGDPGGGGGPRTIVGDCVYSSGDGQVRETSCAGEGKGAGENGGEGKQEPEYEVTKAVGRRTQCPASTALYIQLGGTDPVGCARPL
ncbi:hypothetical protein [Streptomyces blattellae]|uniref:hypothetical protein n=1 Tax=Streptomyces blattellae TaxID=2569855 RepID=UPI0012B8D47A|nr:hypothetical protein [Streptomyces blattellae]